MTKRSKAIYAALLLLLLAGICALLLISNREGFTGSRVKNPDAYLLDIEKMNGTDEYGVVRMEKRRTPAGYMPFCKETN